ncbi:hypothetical protein [uncultured Mediterranean phage uvMED]|nr:hypothetical protein [uncultured Mediterranean phage uvMED]
MPGYDYLNTNLNYIPSYAITPAVDAPQIQNVPMLPAVTNQMSSDRQPGFSIANDFIEEDFNPGQTIGPAGMSFEDIPKGLLDKEIPDFIEMSNYDVRDRRSTNNRDKDYFYDRDKFPIYDDIYEIVNSLNQDNTYSSGLNYARSIADGSNVDNMISQGQSYSSQMPQGYTQQEIGTGGYKGFDYSGLQRLIDNLG